MESYQNIYKAVSEELAEGRKAVILTELSSSPLADNMPAKVLITETELAAPKIENHIKHTLAQSALSCGVLRHFEDKAGNIIIAEPYFPESQLIILGGGHIAMPLSEFSAKCGFCVTVVDDRPAFANSERFPHASRVICEDFDRCFPRLNINKSAFVVIITRGHRHDITCLRQALPLETAYTGMIGSRRRVRAAMEQLSSEGFSTEMLEAVNSPIGLEIGAITPEEIAVSILSELIQYKRQRSASKWPELCGEVLSELCKKRDEPRAIVTIIETRGSVPRGTGAKMLVWPYGKTLGSIGGGCSESSVIQTAYDVIRDGEYRVLDLDMTGEVAEDAGMVCGGTMKVLIEKYI